MFIQDDAINALSEYESPQDVFRTMADCAPVLLWLAGVDAMCNFFNQTWLQFTGRTMAEERGVGWAEGVHPEDFQHCLDTFMNAFRARNPFEMYYRLRRHDGAYRWILDRGVPRFDSDKAFAGYIGSCIDVTESRNIRERQRQVIECSPAATLMVELTGRICMVNAQAERLLRYPREDLLGRSCEMLVPERLRPDFMKFLASLNENGEPRPSPVTHDFIYRRGDGSEFPAEISMGIVLMDEGPMALVAISDVSERNQREEQIKAALREKNALLNEIHHRVKNNLQIVHSLLDMQAKRTVDPAARNALVDGQNRVRSMALIHQTLYQSKDMAEVDFRPFLQSLAPMLLNAYTSRAGQIALHIDTESIHLPIDLAIPCGLIVNELVTNAVKHGFPGGRDGAIWIKLHRDADASICLSVSNDGLPLAEGFDPAHTTSLGMQLISILVAQLDGALSVEGAGPVSFAVRVPVPVASP